MKKPCSKCSPPRLIEASGWIAHQAMHKQAYPSQKHSQKRTSAWRRLRAEALRRSKGQCEWIALDGTRCQAAIGVVARDWECHHVVDERMGGQAVLSNVLALCVFHHDTTKGRRAA